MSTDVESRFYIREESNGYVAIYGQGIRDEVEKIAEGGTGDVALAASCTSRHSPHITLLTKEEAKVLASLQPTGGSSESSRFPNPKGILSDLHFIGGVSTSNRGERFLLVVSPTVSRIRRRMGLEYKQLHVTLSGSGSNFSQGSLSSILAGGEVSKGWDDALPDQVAEALVKDWMIRGESGRALDFVVHLCERKFRANSDGEDRGDGAGEVTAAAGGGITWFQLLLLGNVALVTLRHRLAMLAFAKAFLMLDRQDPRFIAPMGEIRKGKYELACVKGVLSCWKFTELGPVIMTGEEESQLSTLLSPKFSSFLLDPWDSGLEERIRDEYERSSESSGLWTQGRWTCSRSQRIMLPGHSRDHHLDYSMVQRFFSWVIPFRLAASSTPRSARDVQACSHPSLGITLIITLTEEEPLPSDWFPHGMRNTFLPIKNGGQPSLEESHAFTGIVAQEIASGGKVLVHCGGGKGRAGSLIASWLSAFGFTSPSLEIETLAGGFRAWVGQGEWSYPAMGASQSIEAIRSLRPGSIETVEQETFVRKWNQFIAKEGPWPKRIQEPVDSEPSIDSGGESLERALQDVDLVVLVGLPGSGKSTFRKLLCQRDPDRWASVSGDEDGGRRAIERALCNHSRGKRGLVIDRTNITPSSRKEILRLAQHSIKVIAIHFDFPPELCKSRATLRLGHPTLRPSSAGRVIEAFAKELVKPERFEGFSSVITISSIRAAQTLATILSPVQLFKFPRTPHILDLGAASPDDLVVELGNFATIRKSEGSTRLESPGPLAQRDVQDVCVITEKIDGANLGFSLDCGRSLRAQNRSHWVSSADHLQFKKLDGWMERHREDLYKVLDRGNQDFPERWILFGEWMAAVHSIHYTHLPSLFLAYDIYDRKEGIFLTHHEMVKALSETEIPTVPLLSITREIPTARELVGMTQERSRFLEGRREGIYVRIEDGSRVKSRGKVVREDFIAGNVHWTKNLLSWNGVREDLWE